MLDFFVWDAAVLEGLFDKEFEVLLRDDLGLSDDFPIHFDGPVFDETSFFQNVFIGRNQEAYLEMQNNGPMDGPMSFNWVKGQSNVFPGQVDGSWSENVDHETAVIDAAVILERDDGSPEELLAEVTHSNLRVVLQVARVECRIRQLVTR